MQTPSHDAANRQEFYGRGPGDVEATMSYLREQRERGETFVSPHPEVRSELAGRLGRGGMVTVWDEHGRIVGCMGVQLWRALLTFENVAVTRDGLARLNVSGRSPDAAHVHEWEAAGMVEMPHTYHSPVSRNDNVTVNRIYVIQSCKCGSTRHKQVAEGSGARVKR